MKTIFNEIYEKNKWGSKESVSGVGSTLKKTKEIRQFLPDILQEFNIRSLLDAPCGDFNWMKEVDLSFLDAYYGGDIVQDLVDKCQASYEKGGRTFAYMDIATDELPQTDAILVRDLMIHLPNEKVKQVINNIKRNGIQWALFTTYPAVEMNKKIKEGSFRKLNLQAAPFNFPPPIRIFDEGETGWNSGKCIGIWDMNMITTLET